MSYLRLIENKIQEIAETTSSALNIEVAIADKKLTRVAGTGDFYKRINEECSEDSVFAKVIEFGKPIVNLTKQEHCRNCSSVDKCLELANMSYPIKIEDDVIGVVSFASFDKSQVNIIKIKKDEYYNMLRQTAETIEKNIKDVSVANKLNKSIIEINDIINCINKGIIILNSNKEIIHINSTALESLNINLYNYKVIGTNIEEFIVDIKLNAIEKDDIIDFWEINGDKVRVEYNINKIYLEDDEYSLIVSFDKIQNIINIEKTYENKKEVFFENIIGNSKKILDSINRAKIAACTDSTILIQGSSGTGKELFAKSIHNESLRSKGNLVAINCASIPETLIESELFGYEKGSFTGANSYGKKGLIEMANNGTLFLDEIGDLPLHLQTKFLRVLQERTIDRVGGNRPIDVNIRMIAATNRSLRELVQAKKFRLDLYYRLNVIPINLPNLKDREDDVIICSEYIIKKLCSTMNKEIKLLSSEVIKEFKNYDWLGNIRELENVLEHAICFTRDKFIKLEDLPEYFFEESLGDDLEEQKNLDKNLGELKIEYEKEIIKNLIDTHGDSLEGKRIVADKLNIGLTTLYRKINAYKN